MISDHFISIPIWIAFRQQEKRTTPSLFLTTIPEADWKCLASYAPSKWPITHNQLVCIERESTGQRSRAFAKKMIHSFGSYTTTGTI
ncbi:Transaldolase [Gossypium arboreum]|uniref:Transaldolase n=1 Tax=Gossypium arboreum TaxID=29729 RepID=A0A0B0NP92_GOSAR|nr:Transaldolase [Gossypium arboreum]